MEKVSALHSSSSSTEKKQKKHNNNKKKKNREERRFGGDDDDESNSSPREAQWRFISGFGEMDLDWERVLVVESSLAWIKS